MFFWAKAAAARSRRGRASSAGAEFEDILSKARELADSIPCGEREWRGRRFEFCFDSLSAVHALCSGQRHNRSPTDAVQLLQEMLLFGLIERVSKRKDEYTGQTRIHTTSIKVSSHTYYRFNMRKIAERNLVVKVVDAGEDATIVLALAGQAHMVSVGDTCVFGFHQMYPTLSLSVEEATTGTAVASRDMEVKVVENLSTTSDEDKLEALRVDDLSTFDADRDVQARTYRLDSTSSNNVSLAVFAKVNEMDEFASTEGNFETRTWRVCVHIDQVRGAQSRISRLLPGKVVIECGAKVVWLENNHALKIPTVNKEDDRFTSPRQKSRQTKGANFDGERLVVVAAAPRQHAVLRVSVYERLKTDLTRTRRLGVATIPLSDVPISEEPVDEDDDNEDGHRLPKKRTLQLRTGSGSKNGLVVCSVSMMPLLTEDFPADLSARFGFGLRAAVAFLAVLFVLLCALLPRGFLDATLCYSPLLAIVLYVQSPTICASVFNFCVEYMAPGLNLKVGSLRLALWLDRSEMRNDLATRIYKAAVDGSEIVEPKSIETRTRLVFRVEADDFALAHPPEAKFAHEAFLSAKSVVAQISTDRRLLAGLMNIALGSIRLTWNPFPSIHHRRNRRHNDKRGATYIGVVRIDKLVVDDVAINFDLAKGELNVCRLTRMLAFKKVRQALPFHERDSVPNMLSVELISSQHVVATQHRHMHCVVSVRHYQRQSAIQRRPKQSESDDVTWNEFFLIPCPDPSAVLHIGIYSTGGVASKSVLLAQWIVTAKMLVLDPSSVFAAAEDVKSYRGNASSRQASRLCEQTSEEAPTHRNRAFILEGKMRLRDKSFSLFDEEKDAPTLKLRLAYYYESSLPSQEKMLTNYRPLTALEQIQVSSLESTWKLGDPGLAKKMLREFPILIDPRMLVVNRINCNLRDLFSGSYAGTGELMRAKRTNRLVATVGKPVARAVRRQSKALIAKHDCVEETKANDPSNLESVRSSSLKADSLQRRAFEWKNARTTRAFQSRRNFHKDLGGEEDKHLYVKKLDFSGKFQQYFEKRPEGIDLYKIVRTLVTSALVPVLKDHELTGGYAPILAGLAFSRKTALETRSELEDTLSKVPHRGVEEIPALPATAPNPTSEQTSFPSQDASLEEMSTADFYRRGQMQDSVSLQLDFVQQNLAQSGGGRRAAPKIAKRRGKVSHALSTAVASRVRNKSVFDLPPMPSEEIDEGGENEDERSVEGPLDMIYVAVHSKSAISAVSRRTFGIFSRTFVFSWCELRGRVLLFVRRDPKTHDAVGLRQVLRLNNPGVTARYDRGRRQIKLRVPSTTSKAAAHVRLRVASGCHPGFSKPRGYLDMWWTFIAQSTNDNDGKWLDIAQLGPVRLGTFTGDSDDRDEDEEDEDNDEDEDEYDESEDDAYDESDDVFDDEDDGGEEKKMEMEFPVVSYVKGGR